MKFIIAILGVLAAGIGMAQGFGQNGHTRFYIEPNGQIFDNPGGLGRSPPVGSVTGPDLGGGYTYTPNPNYRLPSVTDPNRSSAEDDGSLGD